MMTEFSQTLKSWRSTRRFSQLQLALEADVSARHLSFLESGRAKPSREMIGKLSSALQLPLDAQNQMLTHAGFAARYHQRDWNDEEMVPIRQAMDRLLRSHMPFPAIAFDRLWILHDANASALQLFGQFGVGIGSSLLDFLKSETLPQIVENWAEVAHHTAARLRTESLALGGIAELDQTADHLSKTPLAETTSLGPVMPTIIKLGPIRLSMFVTVAQFGTPEDVALDDMKIEHYFPSDEATERFFRESQPT